MAYVYGEQDSFNAGQASNTASTHVSYRRVISGLSRSRLLQIGAVACLINFFFLAWLINPHHIAGHSSILASMLVLVCFLLFVVVELVRLVQSLALWYFAYHAVDPVPQLPPPGGRIAIITEINTGRETIEQFTIRLQALKAVIYQGTVDVWVLDEDDDNQVKRIANSLHVHHFSRKGIELLNTDGGTFNRDSAYGNANAWRQLHEKSYDIVANVNPDDYLSPHFLERTLGYFVDTDVAFVTIPQVHSNQETWLARAAGAQKFIFNAVLQRGANAFGSPILSGASHLYRTSSWQQIGGYQAGELSDHLTGMTIQGAVNPYTNRAMRGVYTPDILAIGQGPSSWKDYFAVQGGWAHGIWDLFLHHSRKLDRNLRPQQSLYYATMQYFLPGLSMGFIAGNLMSILFFIFGLNVLNVSDAAWVLYWATSFGSQIFLFQWLNKFNLSDYERDQGGLDAIALTLLSLPEYISAAVQSITGKPYSPTTINPSGDETLQAFRPHLIWGMVLAGILVFGLINTGKLTGMVLWSMFALSITLLPIGIIKYRDRRSRSTEVRQLHISNS